MYYYGARYYEPGECRFYGVDPRSEKYDGLSPYNYCINNPLTYIDPEGDTIRIASGQSDFINQLNADLNALRNNEDFAGMMEYLDGHEKDIIIGEGKSLLGEIKNMFSEGSGDEENARASGVTDFGVWGVALDVSQVEGVQIDDIKTESREVTLHELKHAADILNGNYVKDLKDSKSVPIGEREQFVQDRMESRAMQTTNVLREQRGKPTRSYYKGELLLLDDKR